MLTKFYTGRTDTTSYTDLEGRFPSTRFPVWIEDKRRGKTTVDSFLDVGFRRTPVSNADRWSGYSTMLFW